jgi:hypothetical protein
MPKKSRAQIDAALKKITEAHHIDAVMEAIVKEMGGIRKLARIFKEEFHGAVPGSPIKARMLDTLLGMLENRSKTDHSEALELVSDEDLARLAEQLMEGEEDAGE